MYYLAVYLKATSVYKPAQFGSNWASKSDCGNGMSSSQVMFPQQWQISNFSTLHHDPHLPRLSSHSPTQPTFSSFLCLSVTMFQNAHTGDYGSIAGPLFSPDVSTCICIPPRTTQTQY